MNNCVSIIITTYNRLELLKRAHQSVEQQSYPNTEIIIVDTLNVEISDFINSKIENN